MLGAAFDRPMSVSPQEGARSPSGPAEDAASLRWIIDEFIAVGATDRLLAWSDRTQL